MKQHVVAIERQAHSHLSLRFWSSEEQSHRKCISKMDAREALGLLGEMKYKQFDKKLS